MTRHLSNESNSTNTWYLNFCVSGHICNNQDLFLEFRPKNYKFITAGGKIIQSQKVGTIYFLLQRRKTSLLNILYTLNCNSNLILLGQFCESGISYHDYADFMILKQESSPIGVALKHKKLFVLNIDIDLNRDKIMLV